MSFSTILSVTGPWLHQATSLSAIQPVCPTVLDQSNSQIQHQHFLLKISASDLYERCHVERKHSASHHLVLRCSATYHVYQSPCSTVARQTPTPFALLRCYAYCILATACGFNCIQKWKVPALSRLFVHVKGWRERVWEQIHLLVTCTCTMCGLHALL